MITKLVRDYSNTVSQNTKLAKIQNDINQLRIKSNITYDLVEQLYSDLNLTNITNPRESYAVQEFKKRIIDRRLDD